MSSLSVKQRYQKNHRFTELFLTIQGAFRARLAAEVIGVRFSSKEEQEGVVRSVQRNTIVSFVVELKELGELFRDLELWEDYTDDSERTNS